MAARAALCLPVCFGRVWVYSPEDAAVWAAPRTFPVALEGLRGNRASGSFSGLQENAARNQHLRLCALCLFLLYTHMYSREGDPEWERGSRSRAWAS